MRLRNIKGSRQVIAASRYVIAPEGEEASSYEERSSWTVKGRWHNVFGNENPIRVEIGMGKGAFLMELARRNPDINYVGIEKYSSVILRAVQKQDQEELKNVRFIRMKAENINDVFAPEEADRIYLNFSDPWPKAAHEKRRLTSRAFLERYDVILKEHGMIEFKTDNQELFDFSIEEVKAVNDRWKICALTRDLHNDPVLSRDNIMTEYERRWSGEGKTICAMHIIHEIKREIIY